MGPEAVAWDSDVVHEWPAAARRRHASLDASPFATGEDLCRPSFPECEGLLPAWPASKADGQQAWILQPILPEVLLLFWELHLMTWM